MRDEGGKRGMMVGGEGWKSVCGNGGKQRVGSYWEEGEGL